MKTGNGFNHEKGLSNNAIFAQNCGLIAGSKNLKSALINVGYKGIPQKFLTENAPSCEYHHHGSGFNGSTIGVAYYNLEEVAAWLSQAKVIDDLSLFRIKEKERKKEKPNVAIYQWKEYRYEGPYGSTSLHLCQAKCNMKDTGSMVELTIVEEKAREKMAWCKSRYGGASDWGNASYQVGMCFRKKTHNVEEVSSFN